jgi:hypothetical protein
MSPYNWCFKMDKWWWWIGSFGLQASTCDQKSKRSELSRRNEDYKKRVG